MADTSDDDDLSPQPQRTHAPGGGRPHDDDDEFEFENFTDKKGPLKKTLDKPFDEVHEVSDSNDDSHASPSNSPTMQKGKQQAATGGRGGNQFNHDSSFDESTSQLSEASSPPAKKSSKHSKKEKENKKDKHSSSNSTPMQGKPGNMPMSGKPGNMSSAVSAPKPSPQDTPQKAGSSSSEEEESDEEEESTAGADGTEARPSQAALYNPADYKHLVVSSEIQGLFEYIGRHKHTDIELETKMKPFIPDYIPAVGEIDAFLKVPPPEVLDSKKDSASMLGLVVLDEPAAHQSDPTVLELSLRAVNKQVISKHATVGTIEHADKNQARVLKWIQSIEEVHRKKPPPHVHYSRSMPDIEQLMQVWPPEFEELLKSPEFQLPDMNNLDCDVGQFARMVCAIMDIPVYDKVTESLHVLFTLYSEFQNHAYFQH